MLNELRNFLTPTDVYTSQRLMLCLLTSTGFLPLQISGNKYNRRLKVSVIGYIMSLIFIAFNTVSFVISIANGKSTIEFFYKTKVSRFGGLLQFFNTTVVIIMLYGSSLCFSNKIRRCMKNIVVIDRKLNLIGVEISHWKGFCFSIYLIIGFLTINFAVSLTFFFLVREGVFKTDPNNNLPLWAIFITHYLPAVTVTLIVIYFACVAFEIKQRFKVMNMVRFIKKKSTKKLQA